MQDFVFYCDSDLHFREANGIPKARGEKISNIGVVRKDKDARFVIVAGDLTHNGSDGKTIMCVPVSGREYQLQGYIEQYVAPMTSMGLNVYECMGNHDNWTYFPYVYKAIERYILEKHGALRYMWVYGSVRFLSLGIYPDSKALTYLKDMLDSVTPTVLVFHYNLVGDWSDFWSDSEKDEFYKAIKGHTNILLIVTGHVHANQSYVWKGFSVITCGGKGITRCSYSANNNRITTAVVEY